MNQRAFVGGSWSDSSEEYDEKAKDETCLVAQASNEVCSDSSYFSDENSSIDDLTLDNEYDKLCKISLKIITKNKWLKAIRNSLEKKLIELKLKLSTLEKNKGVDLECTNCQSFKTENEKLKEEALKQTKFEKGTYCLNEMLSNQTPSDDKLGLGFNSCEASNSKSREIKFVKSQKEKSSGGSPLNILGGAHIVEAAPKAIMELPICLPGYEKICEITKDGKVIGHADIRLILSLASKELVRNLPKLKFDQHFCDACKIGKLANASHKAKNIVSTTRCLEILHMDLFGPSAVQSYGGNRYNLVIVDDYSSKCFILNTKDYLTKFDPKSYEGVFLDYSQNSKAYIILNKHTRKIEESLNVTFDETAPHSKTSPLVDDDLDEEEAIKVTEKKILENNIGNETLEIDEIVNLKKSRNHSLENVIGYLNQRTLSLEDSKPMKTPMSSDTKLTKDEECESIDTTNYRGMIGIETVVYADSDHAGDYVDRKSTSGICTFVGCCLTSWFSKKQTTLAISTIEAEYVSARKACQQALWMKQALIYYDVRLDDVPIHS
ncbi:retrovirus-related pol polyprotein from transposon TNT 1-94 [Tanacetum coccineum]